MLRTITTVLLLTIANMLVAQSNRPPIYAYSGWTHSTFDYETGIVPFIGDKVHSTTYTSPAFGIGIFAWKGDTYKGFKVLVDMTMSSMRTEENIQVQESATQLRIEKIEFKYFRTKFSFGPRYYFVDKKFSPYVGAGVVFNFYMAGNGVVNQLQDFTNNPDVTTNAEGDLSGLRMIQTFAAAGCRFPVSDKINGYIEFRGDFLGNNTNSVIKLDQYDVFRNRAIKTRTLGVLVGVIF